jgi:hypothetical protein
MKERPILFSGEMIRALLRDEKTQTRRVIKPQPLGNLYTDPLDGRWLTKRFGGLLLPRIKDLTLECPFGQVGDRLWVRETWTFFDRYSKLDECHQGPEDPKSLVKWAGDSEQGRAVVDYWKRRLLFRADEPFPHIDWNVPWHPSIFMPRWASRITLEITDVRVEHLESISEEDAKAEGVTLEPCTHPGCDEDSRCAADSYRGAYAVLWNKINVKKYPWGNLWWVWVVHFKRLTLPDE